MNDLVLTKMKKTRSPDKDSFLLRKEENEVGSPIETAIDIVKGYRESLDDIFTSLPFKYPFEYTLEQKSYSRWAVSEILDRLEHNTSIPPLVTIENFRSKLYEFSLINRRNSFIFEIAYEAIDDIIDMLVSQ